LVGLILCALSATALLAEDVEPKVSPDPIEDVPSTKPDPFPAFDNFSWRAFIALAWPSRLEAAHRGEADRAKSLGDPGPRVWETFKSRYEIFQPPSKRGAAAPAWASYSGQNPCGSAIANDVKTLGSFGAFADFNQAGFTPGAFTGPLVAQNRTYTRYETRVNKAEFDSVVGHNWFRRRFLPTAEHPAVFNEGSIAVKAAWRILTDRDAAAVRARYYVVRDAEVLDVAKTLETGAIVCSKQDVALVGLHIVVKTRYRPQGVWSSFEHVDNVAPAGMGEAREPDAVDAQAPYSYYDPHLAEPVRAAQDRSPPQPVGWANPPKLDPQPTQVVRRHPIGAETMAMNRAYWSLPAVRGTVWSHYMLVATQWPTVTHPDSPQNDGAYFPGTPAAPNAPAEVYQLSASGGDRDRNLINTTMETYFQDVSCMACHHAVANALGRDFVAFIAQDAR
jgi:hypothetical protein